MAERLRARRTEIEDAIVTRIRNVAHNTGKGEDVQYEEGQRAAVVAVLSYALAGIERGEERASLTPSEAVAQVHRAARSGVGLDIILRRYIAGHAVLEDFVMQEADRGGLRHHGAELRGVQRMQASLLDSLIVSVNEEYAREVQRVSRSPEQRRAERVRRLLAGGLVDSAELGYELDVWHLGVIGTGMGVGQAVRGLAAELDCQLLCVSHDEQCVWVWLGGCRKAVVDDVKRLMSTRWPTGVWLTVGEPREGVDGWRWTHQEAHAALLVAKRKPQKFTRCADVVLEAATCRDDVLARTLRDAYLSPLDDLRIGGDTARETLRAYFAAGHNISVTADRLKVDRRTVWYRLEKIEQRLGCPLEKHRAELEVALRLAELDDVAGETGRFELGP